MNSFFLTDNFSGDIMADYPFSELNTIKTKRFSAFSRNMPREWSSACFPRMKKKKSA